MFAALVDDRDDLEIVEKFTYLKQSVAGEARKVIDNILITPEGYETAKMLLKKRYADTTKLVRQILQEISDMKVAETYPQALDFSFKLQSAVRQLSNMGTEADNIMLLTTATKKISPYYYSLVVVEKAAMEAEYKVMDVDRLLQGVTIVDNKLVRGEAVPLKEMPWNVENFLVALDRALKKRDEVMDASGKTSDKPQSSKPGGNTNKFLNYSKGTGGQQPSRAYYQVPGSQRAGNLGIRQGTGSSNANYQQPRQQQGEQLTRKANGSPLHSEMSACLFLLNRSSSGRSRVQLSRIIHNEHTMPPIGNNPNRLQIQSQLTTSLKRPQRM